ncbi:hypothetical protein [Mucilaginibacter sp. PAMB04168]|uniref:hypothetical protein n=1 Tax=Mucilaginibacter sp. PAMB04168 TaxID=3138567 RepID=UPI0031F6BC83
MTQDNKMMDWGQYIKESFFDAWGKSTPVDLSDYAFLFQHHFDVSAIESQVIKMISEAEIPGTAERYHRIRLRKSIQIFIDVILNISDDGKHINNKNITHAKLILQKREDCIYA